MAPPACLICVDNCCHDFAELQSSPSGRCVIVDLLPGFATHTVHTSREYRTLAGKIYCYISQLLYSVCNHTLLSPPNPSLTCPSIPTTSLFTSEIYLLAILIPRPVTPCSPPMLLQLLLPQLIQSSRSKRTKPARKEPWRTQRHSKTFTK
jgi:hypothetical protein